MKHLHEESQEQVPESDEGPPREQGLTDNTSPTNEQVPKEDNTTTSPAEQAKILGVSVHHLKHVFLKSEIIASNIGLSESSTIYNIEDLRGPPGVIRRRGADVICPHDGQPGASYVDCLSGEDHVGTANFMLSYTWG